MSRLRILFASPEVTPFAKTGGLADVSAALPAALSELGHQVIIVMPLHRSVREGDFGLKQLDATIEVSLIGQVIKDEVFYLDREPNLKVYFIKRDEFFDRSALYGTSEGDYPDNGERFIFFSKGVLNIAKKIGFKPHIIHCNDWQSGLVPVYLKSIYKNDALFQSTRSVFTIHNLAYQGVFPQKYMEISELPSELFSINSLEYYGQMNFMKGGIVFSDVVTTVSEKYSLEIQTPEYGHGLDGVLRERSAAIHGILNGVDYAAWNPETDPHIAANYRAEDLSGKKKCKEELRQVLGIKGPVDAPIIGVISRLADQKGFDLLADSLDELLEMGFSLVLLGKGDEKYETLFKRIGETHKNRIGIRIAFDDVLAHKIEAGSDMFLMPSRYEPCGLNQMYSLKYGTIPVVRATGGLEDTIEEFDPKTGEGNGFKFVEYSSQALIDAARKALAAYQDKQNWLRLVKKAMKEDFSWEKSAMKYEKIYKKILTRGGK